MRFLDKEAPWDSPVVHGIPLPPFADDAEHYRFVRMLQLHLALLDDGLPSLSTVALSLALEPPRFRTDGEDSRWLTPLELSVSLTSWFPAPWTPGSLARTLAREHRDPPIPGGESWYWLTDPDFTATPHPDGGWSVTRRERGAVDSGLIGDRDLIVLWISIYRAKFAFPLAHRGYDADMAALAPASLAVSAADKMDAAYAYRTSWRTEREAALGAALKQLESM